MILQCLTCPNCVSYFSMWHVHQVRVVQVTHRRANIRKTGGSKMTYRSRTFNAPVNKLLYLHAFLCHLKCMIVIVKLCMTPWILHFLFECTYDHSKILVFVSIRPEVWNHISQSSLIFRASSSFFVQSTMASLPFLAIIAAARRSKKIFCELWK